MACSSSFTRPALQRNRFNRPPATFPSFLRSEGDEGSRRLEIIPFLAAGWNLDPAVDALLAFLNRWEIQATRFGRQTHAEAELVEIGIRQRPATPCNLVNHLGHGSVRPLDRLVESAHVMVISHPGFICGLTDNA